MSAVRRGQSIAVCPSVHGNVLAYHNASLPSPPASPCLAAALARGVGQGDAYQNGLVWARAMHTKTTTGTEMGTGMFRPLVPANVSLVLELVTNVHSKTEKCSMGALHLTKAGGRQDTWKR